MSEIKEEFWQFHAKKLPHPAVTYIPAKGLRWEFSIIGNFLPIIPRKIIYHTSTGVEDWFHLQLFENGEIVASKDIKISAIDKIDWFSEFSCNIQPGMKSKFNYILKHLLSDKEVKSVDYQLIDKVGWQKITIAEDDIYCFNTGDTLILPSDINPEIAERVKIKKSEYALKADTEKYTEQQAATGMAKALSIYRQVSLFILAFIIATLLKSVFRECGIVPKFVLYVCGKRDSLKTAYTKLLSPICHKNDENSNLLIQFNSSNYAVSDLTNNYPDFPVILDNVYISEDPSIKKQITEIFEKSVQIIGDDADKSNAHRTIKPASGIIGTGENDAIGNASTVARYLTLLFANNAIKSSEKQSLLHQLQQEPTMISTAYFYFLQYAVDNIGAIKSSIKQELIAFRATQSALNISEKLKERFFILCTCYLLFLKYCMDKEFLSKEQALCLKDEFKEQLLDICHRHNQTIVSKEEKANTLPDDFLELIKFWHNTGEFKMAKDENDKNLRSKEALIYDGFLCITSESLMKKINQAFPSAKYKDVAAQLAAKNALKADEGRNTAKIKGIRFLKIPLKKLK